MPASKVRITDPNTSFGTSGTAWALGYLASTRVIISVGHPTNKNVYWGNVENRCSSNSMSMRLSHRWPINPTYVCPAGFGNHGGERNSGSALRNKSKEAQFRNKS